LELQSHLSFAVPLSTLFEILLASDTGVIGVAGLHGSVTPAETSGIVINPEKNENEENNR
jgi:hypothetical protein